VSGKGGKTRYLPLHPGTSGLIHDYLETAGHGAADDGALFRPIRNNRTGRLDQAMTPDGVYKLVRAYSASTSSRLCLAVTPHSRCTTVSSLADRPTKIFLDYTRNGLGATYVGCCSPRARMGFPVAMPVAAEIMRALKASDI
jgi:hypothetical protein